MEFRPAVERQLIFCPSSKRAILGSVLNRLKPMQNAWRAFLLRGFGAEVDTSCLIGANVTANLGFSLGKRG